MQKVELPQGITAQIDQQQITIKGSLGSNTRRFNASLLGVKAEQNAIVIASVAVGNAVSKAVPAEKALAKELSNDILGVTNYFEKNMTAVYAHFPMTVEVKENQLVIKNMFGERALRYADIVGSTKVEVKAQKVRVYGTSLDDVSQTVANIRRSCKVKQKDVRIFQDGIYVDVE